VAKAHYTVPCEARSKIRPIRFTPTQDRELLKFADYLSGFWGRQVSVSWVVHAMIAEGRDAFYEKYVEGKADIDE